MKKDLFLSIFSTGLLLTSLCLLPAGSSLVGAITTESIELDVAAECAPHADVAGPSSMSLLFVPVTSRGAPTFTATLYPENLPSQNEVAHRWDFPEKAWHSVVFEGPPITARFFCQTATPKKDLYVSYYPERQVKIAISQSPVPSAQELDTIDTNARRSMVSTSSDAEGSSYSAGKGTNSQYWLTFSIPVHSDHDIKTTVKYEFP